MLCFFSALFTAAFVTVLLEWCIPGKFNHARFWQLLLASPLLSNTRPLFSYVFTAFLTFIHLTTRPLRARSVSSLQQARRRARRRRCRRPCT
jgi:hypothetical protein